MQIEILRGAMGRPVEVNTERRQEQQQQPHKQVLLEDQHHDQMEVRAPASTTACTFRGLQFPGVHGEYITPPRGYAIEADDGQLASSIDSLPDANLAGPHTGNNPLPPIDDLLPANLAGGLSPNNTHSAF